MKTFITYNKNMVKSILKGENLRRVFFAFLKDNNAFYNYIDAFYNCHSSRHTEFREHPSFSYFLDFCDKRGAPTDLIYNAFYWTDTKEDNWYWKALYDRFCYFCSEIREEEGKRNIEEIKEDGWSFVYTGPIASSDTSMDLYTI